MASPFLSSPTPHHRAGHTHSGSKQRPTFEVADILRAHLPDSLHEHSLQAFAARHWNGTLGITAVLHTWGQTMERHIHLHCIVPGGALTFDGEQFKPCPHRDWLFPVKALSKVFRGNYLERLEHAHTTGELKTPPGTHFAALRKALREHDWVVYAKPPFGGPQQIIDYLGRYTHRIAISNHRILNLADGKGHLHLERL
jgi:hypothetical protein